MTTINNLSIEKMREIVGGRPICSGHYNFVNGIVVYYQFCGGSWYWYNEERKQYELDCSKSLKRSINDLRTAIAEHDEFKVGDLVCFIDSRIMFPDGETKTNELFKVIRSDGLEVDLTEIGHSEKYKTWIGDLRHATPSEIKAGHRLDDATDHVTDIRNHISPSTMVVDL